MAKPKNLERAEEIKQVVARLFADKGYHATSMREVARELGMNQASLYHYFKSKEDILYTLMNDAMDKGLPVLNDICTSDISAEEKLSRILAFYTRYYAGDQESLTLLVSEMHSLSERHYVLLRERQREYVFLIKSILDELATDHKMKDIDPTVATFAFFGMVHYTVKWYNKDGRIMPDDLANFFVEIFTRGILKS
ncbi:TetR/AcrR family transcriptional regulator [Desulfonema magnum]|uniref:Transcription regulator HTH motif-containing protein n=1 Tax=Desulfonema magnum TaxID=45655 RepID=A0A975GQM6_9BACT|nr:TetR/AcrR family transcriptional regulator [Desulfonema magnum]QTA90059.1 Transcription regulator HTH motif-containing protein [Desulfonema magnum]